MRTTNNFCLQEVRYLMNVKVYKVTQNLYFDNIGKAKASCQYCCWTVKVIEGKESAAE